MDITFFQNNEIHKNDALIGEIKIKIYNMKAEIEFFKISKQDALDVLFAIVEHDFESNIN